MNIHEKLKREKENNRKLQMQLEKISEKKKASDAKIRKLEEEIKLSYVKDISIEELDKVFRKGVRDDESDVHREQQESV